MTTCGINLDSKGGREHYRTKQDIVALKCGKHQDYFACCQCHNQLRNHPFKSISVKAASPVLCGNCRHFLTYTEYKRGACPYYYHDFNPNCHLHETTYFEE